MKIYRSIQDYNEEKRSVVTIGTFDGLHQGHQKIFSRLINTSKDENLSSVVLTFFPHPRIILNKYNDLYEINDSEIPSDIQIFVKSGDMAAALLRIVEVIGQDNLNNIDEDTLYFIISTLNQLNVDPLRNRILFKVLPLKV